MNADILRQAAALMRERAEAARAGRWLTAESACVTDARLVVADWEHEPRRVATCSGSIFEGNLANAEHIASWHPAVALAVAVWLDKTASGIERRGVTARFTPAETAALAVATAYLGDPR